MTDWTGNGDYDRGDAETDNDPDSITSAAITPLYVSSALTAADQETDLDEGKNPFENSPEHTTWAARTASYESSAFTVADQEAELDQGINPFENDSDHTNWAMDIALFESSARTVADQEADMDERENADQSPEATGFEPRYSSVMQPPGNESSDSAPPDPGVSLHRVGAEVVRHDSEGVSTDTRPQAADETDEKTRPEVDASEYSDVAPDQDGAGLPTEIQGIDDMPDISEVDDESGQQPPDLPGGDLQAVLGRAAPESGTPAVDKPMTAVSQDRAAPTGTLPITSRPEVSEESAASDGTDPVSRPDFHEDYQDKGKADANRRGDRFSKADTSGTGETRGTVDTRGTVSPTGPTTPPLVADASIPKASPGDRWLAGSTIAAGHAGSLEQVVDGDVGETVEPVWRMPEEHAAIVGSKAWRSFARDLDGPFLERLDQFGGDPYPPDEYRGGEGQLFVSEDYPTLALKRWHASRDDFTESVNFLINVRAAVRSDVELSAVMDVVGVHERGADWIVRDFDRDSVPLRDALPSNASARRALAVAMEALDGATDDSLRAIRQRLSRPAGPSANVHWSVDTGKLLVVDMR